jgi:hypothetical protein
VRRRVGSAAALLLLFLAGPVTGQDPYGALRGVVADETGARLPGARITLTHLDSDRALDTASGPYGDYLLTGMLPGAYRVRIELAGFDPVEIPDALVRPAETLELETRLRISPVGTTIEVTEVAGAARPTGAAPVRSIEAEEFDRLPNARSFETLAGVASGVNTGVIGGGIQINGSSGAENVFLVDGIPTGSLIDGSLRQRVPFEYLEQIQVSTALVPARYPGAMGGVVSAATRSGGNEFHGEVHLYLGLSAFAAGPVPRLVLDPLDEITVGVVQDPEDAWRSIEGGASIGGPLLRDRLFLYSAWSPRYTRRERSYLLSNGTVPDVFVEERRFMSGFNKISFEPTRSIRSSLALLWTPATSVGTLAAPNLSGPGHDTRTPEALAPNRTRGYFQPQTGLDGSVDLALSPGLVLGARGSYVHDNYKDTAISPTSSVEYQTSAVGLEGVPALLQQGVGFSNTPRVLRVDHDLASRATGQVDVAMTLRRHSLRAGYGLERRVNNIDSAFPGGGFVLVFWDRTFTLSPTGVEDRGPYGYYEVHDAGTGGSAGATTGSAYIQDAWQVRPGLTLSLGVRLEDEAVPAFARDRLGRALEVGFGWSEKIAPRLGASWDPLGNGSVRTYGGYGRYFDQNKFEWARSALGGSFWRIRYRSLDTPEVFSLSGTNMPGRDLWLDSVPDSYRDLAQVDFDRAVDPDLRPMSRDEYVAGVDYRWDADTTFGVRYLRSRLNRVIEDFARIVSGSAVFTYGNPGEGVFATDESPSTSTDPFPFPRAVRDYDALDVTIARRFSGGWFANLAYTWSRLAGNYPGLANADDLRTPTLGFGFPTSQQQGSSIGRPGGNTTLGWDLDEVLFDSRGRLDVRGRLPTDRPHVLRATGGYDLAWGRAGTTALGVVFYAGSGTPLSTRVNTTHRLPVLVNGRGDMGRTPVLATTDLNIGHAFPVTEGQSLRFEVTLLNVFDQKTPLHRFEHLNRGAAGSRDSSSIELGGVNLAEGYDYDALILASPDLEDAYDPRYGLDDLFQTGFEGRLGIKWTF